jgi:hypothetical protein
MDLDRSTMKFGISVLDKKKSPSEDSYFLALSGFGLTFANVKTKKVFAKQISPKFAKFAKWQLEKKNVLRKLREFW